MISSRMHLCRIVFCLWLTIIFTCALDAQTRRALLIGIDNYAPAPGATLPVPSAGHARDSRFAPGTTWISLHGPAVDVPSMYELLQNTYGFKDIRLLTEQQSTRQGILAAIDQLIADTHPGDLDVFYYSGHGSRRVDTLSTKNHFDQTIVPIDAWKGAEDIRDKELALRFAIAAPWRADLPRACSAPCPTMTAMWRRRKRKIRRR
jgi:hypothetical protein